VPPAGTTAGAVYSPELETVPTVALPPCVPFTYQFTEALVVPVTVAVNCWLEPLFTVAEVGDTATVIGEGDAATVTAALADFVASAALLAVTVTELPEGTAAGAV
jgi:hypothetical protein